MRQSIVTYAGRDERGGDLFDMSFSYPDAEPGVRYAGDRQRGAIKRFYRFDLPEQATDDQAHALLTYRDFACAAVERVESGANDERQETLSLFAAAFISQDRDIAAAVTDWCERRFARGADPDRLPAAVARHPAYSAVEAFVRAALRDMRDVGASL